MITGIYDYHFYSFKRIKMIEFHWVTSPGKIIFFCVKIFKIIYFFNDNKSRAISITRTIFRLNTNWGHAYENCNMTKIQIIKYNKHQHTTKLIAHTPFSAWRVVSTHLRLNSPWRDDSRLLVIPYSCSRVSDYNSRIVMSNFKD